MNRIVYRLTHFAGIVLLALTPAIAQLQPVREVAAKPSIISLVPSARPTGDSLARTSRDATFENAPPNYHVFASASVAESAGVETLSFSFAGETTLAGIKMSNKNFAIEPGGSCYEGNHYTRGESCSLLVRFTPQGPGHKLAFVQLTHSAEAGLTIFGLVGNAYAPVVSFTPSQITTVVGSVTSGTGMFNAATNMAIDGGDVLYIPDTGNNKVELIDSSGVITPFPLNPISAPASIAADSFGILYTANVHSATYYFSIYYPWGSQTAYGYAYTSSTCTVASPCAFSAVGMNYPANVSIDTNNNLFFEEGTTGAAEMPVANVSGGTATLNLWDLSDQFSYSSGSPGSFAVDANDNLYSAYHFSTTACYLLRESLYSSEYSPSFSRVAGGAACGFSGDGGQGSGARISNQIGQMAFDVAGNLYFADAGNQRVRRVDAATGIISTIAGTGTAGYSGDYGAATSATLSSPTGVAVDSQGQVFILSNAPTAGPTQAMRKVGTHGYWAFFPQVKQTPSAAKVITVSNTGNTTLSLSTAPAFTGTNPSDFSIDPLTTDCVLTTGATLPAGRSCHIGIIFTPSGTGARSASLLLQDNTIAGTNTILLNGNGILPSPTVAITSPTSGSMVKAGTVVTFAVKVTSTLATQPTGTVTFKVNGTAVGSPVTLSGGTASTTFSESTVATYSLSATYNGDSNFAPAAAAESLIVDAIKKPVVVLLQAGPPSPSVCGMMDFFVKVTPPTGGLPPSGTVQLMNGSSLLGTGQLQNGSAVLSIAAPISARAPISNPQLLFAVYSGDETYQSGRSPSLSSPLPSSRTCGTH